jgi:hypothetical protein
MKIEALHWKTTKLSMRPEVLMVMKRSMFVFWVVMPCGLVDRGTMFL